MKRILAAAVILITAACAPTETIETTAVDVAEPSATAVPTTAAAVLPAPSPTAVVVPLPPPTAVPATATPVPTSAPEPTQAPATTADPAQPPRPTVAPTPSQSNAIMVANGAEVYTIACARCHGANGTGSERYGGLLGVGNRYSSAAMIEELTNGHPITFGFAGQLSADEIASVVAYVKATYP